mgnify:CR=1 FL=1
MNQYVDQPRESANYSLTGYFVFNSLALVNADCQALLRKSLRGWARRTEKTHSPRILGIMSGTLDKSA